MKILLGMGRLGKFSSKHEVTNFGSFEVFWEFVPKIVDDTPNFQEDFYLHMFLLKQHLLELSPLSF